MSDLNVLIDSQYLFLRSAQTNTYDSVFEFDTDVMTAMPEHQMSLTVVDFTMQIQYYVVNSLNNQLTFTDVASGSPSTTITVPLGNYSYRDLCLTVSRLYPSVTCTYGNHSNRAVFTFTTSHVISFTDNSYQTFGFNSSDTPSGTTIISTNQLDLKGGVNQLVLHASGVSTTACWNVDNFSSATNLKCKPSDVLAVIPFDTAPFTVLHWQNPGNQFEMFLNERNISRLQISIKDIYGNDLTYLNPYTITFLVRIYKKNVQDGQNRTVGILSEILDYTKLSLIKSVTGLNSLDSL
jgi:hypothetical protein